ncbi:flagellar hook-basal body complex protein FliE [Paenirhodobacter sp.]|uniref:flagellar hook-basal body complex protein FliE n=1 Tax=Paenirhodobacter sp. TaxID=1965326 RepID=UPI003B41AF2F
MDIRSSLASLGYSHARNVAAPDPEASSSSYLASAVENFQDTVRGGEEAAKGAMLGTVDPHALVEALANTELAVETAVAVRNKVVEAYQQILQMPV